MKTKMYAPEGDGGSKRRGFAAMNSEQQREIARKGGRVVSANRDHMAAIGRKGGVASHGGGRRPAESLTASGQE